MIKEAADTIVELKRIIDGIRSDEIDASTGLRLINNNFWVNGLDKTHEIAVAEAAFVASAATLATGADLLTHALKDEKTRESEYQEALTDLRAYRDALRGARLRDDATMIGSADDTEVDDPII
ncbi:MAG: hypothetical protein PGN33_20060 [Methylobacterium radiotolerans]